MAIVRDRETSTKIEGGFFNFITIKINFNTGEVDIETSKELPPLKVQKTTEKEGIAGIELGMAFSKAFGVLAGNKVAVGNEAPEPVQVALEDLRKKTGAFLDAPHTSQELGLFVITNSRELAGLAAFENLPSPYIQPALEELKKVMRQVILDRPQLPKTT